MLLRDALLFGILEVLERIPRGAQDKTCCMVAEPCSKPAPPGLHFKALDPCGYPYEYEKTSIQNVFDCHDNISLVFCER